MAIFAFISLFSLFKVGYMLSSSRTDIWHCKALMTASELFLFECIKSQCSPKDYLVAIYLRGLSWVRVSLRGRWIGLLVHLRKREMEPKNATKTHSLERKHLYLFSHSILIKRVTLLVFLVDLDFPSILRNV
mgnify:CR=1 FL=1